MAAETVLGEALGKKAESIVAESRIAQLHHFDAVSGTGSGKIMQIPLRPFSLG
jgi:hypothetical protein